MHFLLDGKEKTHAVYQQVIDDHPEDKEGDFIAAFTREQRSRGSDLGSFTRPQLYHLLADLFGAGVDTTVTTLRWFLIFIAHHQDIQVCTMLCVLHVTVVVSIYEPTYRVDKWKVREIFIWDVDAR